MTVGCVSAPNVHGRSIAFLFTAVLLPVHTCAVNTDVQGMRFRRTPSAPGPSEL